jgi:DNA topoisomerase-2
MRKSLRYGSVMILCDQDLDGFHIKGLTANLFHSHWTELAKLNEFLCFMNTPILKAKKGTREKLFYNEDQYEQWKAENSTRGWTVKYYKGLGTSTAKEFKEYFKHKKIVQFQHDGKKSDDAIDLAFNKKRADDRKEWLAAYDKTAVLNTDDTSVSYGDFIHRELIHFSKYDTERSIPNLMDGLKTSQRKILYSAFKRNLTKEIKVAQFGGYVSEHSGYHHGEMSLMKAIVGMAQEFVGSNNLNLLLPNGQFGTRLTGGQDSASERYIFTQLNPLTRLVFPEADLPVLTYLEDDGTPVEPEFYAPILPMILVNGATGIGTGFSTNVMSYDPLELTAYIRERLEDEKTTEHTINFEDEFEVLSPYFEGFKGKVEHLEGDKFSICGVYEITGKDKLRITELPIGTWTDNYKNFLEGLMTGGLNAFNKAVGKKAERGKKDDAPILKEYKDMSTDVEVDLTLTFQAGILEALQEKQKLETFLKLLTTQRTSNIYLFDENQQIKKYKTPNEVIDAYMPTRLSMYHKRKAYQIKELERIVRLLSNRARFIEEQCLAIDDPNVLVLQRKSIQQVNQILEERQYDKIEGDYKYLTSMPMSSVMEENRQKLLREKREKEQELEKLSKKTVRTMWLEELEEFEDAWERYRQERRMRLYGRK